MGPDLQRLVLVFVTVPAIDGDSRYRVGTGYFLTRNLVLTASHIVPENAEVIEVRVEGSAEFHRAQTENPIAWRDAGLDGVLIRVAPGLGEISPPQWTEAPLLENVEWSTTAYPIAAKQLVDERENWTTRGLKGTLYWQGGAGQGTRELDLEVDAPATPEGWGGISGAPVFVNGRLAGIIKDVPKDFRGGRLSGVPANALLAEPTFQAAIAKPWLELPSDRPVLVLLSEARRSELPRRVKAAIETFNNDRLALETAGGALASEPVKVAVTDVLQSPEHWFQFIKALCTAPVMIADVTGFEPAVMLLLGIRAVVRRGVTIASTSDHLDEAHFSKLPFNIQESKLISHSGAYAPSDPKNPVLVISAAMRDGLRELYSHSRYLDLPVYDAVRCPKPQRTANGRPPPQKSPDGDKADDSDTIVVLCPFQQAYKSRWLEISSRLLDQYPNKRIVRMIDISSPRLVGQALYEQIRWAKTCIVDWTYWRPNVFFELGVRLACADTGPICLLDRGDPGDPGSTTLTQLPKLAQTQQLIELFAPNLYQFAPVEASEEERDIADKDFTGIFEAHEAIKRKRPIFVPSTTISHNATYRFLIEEFDWTQERINLRPDQLLRASAEADVGRDEQSSGETAVLFSSNFEFSIRLRQSVYERWVAAWCYLVHRYEDEFETNAERREELKALGENVLQALPKTNDPFLKRLRNEIVDKIDEFS